MTRASQSTAAAKLAVIGWPVEHSLSPLIHGHWIGRFGIDATYDRVAVEPEALEAFITTAAAQGYRGYNITLPHKQQAMQYLDRVDAPAARIGAVNTVTITATGQSVGTNTDADGFLADLLALEPAWNPASAAAMVLGAGGAARAVIVALATAGVPEVRIANRTDNRARAMIESLAAQDPELGDRLQAIPWSDRLAAGRDLAVFVNATSAGLVGAAPLDFAPEELAPHTIVYDLVYGPDETALVKAARSIGLRAHDGLGMLCRQAALAFQCWFSRLPPIDDELVSLLRNRL